MHVSTTRISHDVERAAMLLTDLRSDRHVPQNVSFRGPQSSQETASDLARRRSSPVEVTVKESVSALRQVGVCSAEYVST